MWGNAILFHQTISIVKNNWEKINIDTVDVNMDTTYCEKLFDRSSDHK